MIIPICSLSISNAPHAMPCHPHQREGAKRKASTEPRTMGDVVHINPTTFTMKYVKGKSAFSEAFPFLHFSPLFYLSSAFPLLYPSSAVEKREKKKKKQSSEQKEDAAADVAQPPPPQSLLQKESDISASVHACMQSNIKYFHALSLFPLSIYLSLSILNSHLGS